MSRFRQVALMIIAAGALTSGTLFAQGANPPKRKYPPLPANAQMHRSHDEWFRDVTKRIEDGTATTQQRRAWYEARKRYYPFTPDAIPSNNWRVEALKQGNAIDQRRASAKSATPQAVTDYTWSQLGGSVPWAQGQPPAASPNSDFGAGRGTAIWVNPNDKRDVLLGFADGGVWKSTNVTTTENTATWTPLTDFQPTLSVGSVVARVSATDSNRLGPNTTIWLATGEGNFGSGDVQGVGILKSVDGGATWQLKQIPWVVAGDGTTMYDRRSIRRIALDGRDPNKLWVAADSGVYRSIDAGETWTLVSSLPYFKKYAGDCWYVYVTDLLVDDQTPAVGQPSHVYVANGRLSNAGCSTIARVDNAVFRTTDDGATWTNISVPNANCPGVVGGTTSRGYSCVGTGFTASGLTNATTVNGSVGRMTLLHGAGNKKKLYVLIQDISGSGGNSLGIYRTTDASAATVTWTQSENSTYCNGQCWYDITGAVSPANDARVYIGGIDGYWSTNSGGATGGQADWFNTTSWTGWGGANYAHADHHHAVWVDATTLYLVTDGGFHIGTVPADNASTNGITFVNNNVGAMTMQAYGIAQSAQSANRIHVGTQDNGQPKVVLDGSNNITQWWEIRGGDGGFSATDRGSDAIAYQEYVYASLYRATNASYTTTTAWNWSCIRNFGGCATCSGSCVPDNATEFIAPFMLDRNNQARGYSASRKVYRWNGGTTWVSYSPDLTTTNDANDIIWVHSAFNNGVAGTLWAVTFNGRVWRTYTATTDTADSPSWVDTTKAPLPNRTATWVETHPTNGTWAYVTFSGYNTSHVFRTKDGGTTWVDVSASLPNEPFNSVAVDPSNPDRVFVGSDFGVYVNEDGWNGSTWLRINNGALPYVKVYHLDFSPVSGGTLRAATHGRGIWELTIGAGAGCGGSVPAAPPVTATPGNNQVTLSWPAVSGAVAYRVYRVSTSTCPAGSGGTVIGSGITGTSFVDTTALNGTDYAYFVTALNASNCEGPQSACVTAQPSPCTPLAPPSTVTATASAERQITVDWSAVVGATSYKVYRATGACSATVPSYTLIASGIAGTSYVDVDDASAVASATTYSYKIVTTTACDSALSSACAYATAWGTCSTPPTFAGLPVGGVTTPASSTCALDLSWVAGSSNCDGTVTYSVYRSTTSGFTPSASNRVAGGITATSYTDTAALAPNTTYYYVVRASDTANGLEEGNLVERSGTTAGSCSSAPLPIQVFTIRATGTSTLGENVLEWWNPSFANAGTTATITFRTDMYPTGPADPAATVLESGRTVTAGAYDSVTHSGLTIGTTYYYAIWVRY